MSIKTYFDQTEEQRPEPNTLILEDRSLRLGFLQLPKQVLYARNLSRDAKLLYAILLGYAWQEDRCFPGYHRLCLDMQASENMVRKYMRELEAVGLLSQRRRGLGKTNIYYLHDLRTSKIEVLEHHKTAVPEPKKTEGKLDPVERYSDHKYSERDSSNIRMASRLVKADKRETKPEAQQSDSTSRLTPTEGQDEVAESNSRNIPTSDSDDQREPRPLEAPSSRNTRSGLTSIGETLKARAPSRRFTRSTKVEPPSPNGETPPGQQARPPDSKGLDVNTSNTENLGAESGTPRGRPPDEARQIITSYIADFAPELGDEAKLPVTISRAVNLYKRSGIEIGQFTGLLYEARSRCKEYTATIKKERKSDDGWYAGKNKIPYFFAILEELLGFREPRTRAESGADTDRGKPARSDQGRSRGGRYPPPAT